MELAKVTDKCQITIPKAVREQLGVKVGDNVVFIAKGKGFVVLSANDVERLQNNLLEKDID